MIANIFGKIDEQTVEYLYKQLKGVSSDEEVTLIIDSKGGSMTSLYKILDLINPYKNITTVALTDCESCAANLFLIGNKRYVLKETEFMLHRPAYNADELVKDDIRLTSLCLKELLKTIEDDDAWLKAFLEKNHVPKNIIKRIFSNDRNLIIDSNSLIKLGIATKIIDVNISIINND